MMDQSTKPVLDLSLAAWEYTYGDIRVVGTWLRHDRRPCMVLVPAFKRPTHAHVQPCVVPMDHAYLWDEHTGDGQHVAQMSMRFSQGLGMGMTPHVVFRVTSIVRECLGDLLRMGPMPDVDRTVVADAIAVDLESGRVTEREITDDV